MIALDEIIRSRRRTLAIVVEEDGRVVARAPMRMAQKAIHEFARSKAQWIVAKQEQARLRASRFSPKQFVSGEEFLFLGESYHLEIDARQSRPLIWNEGFHLAAAAQPRAAAVFERWYRRRALRVISERVALHAASNGFEFSRVRITSARKRWGSCGSGGNLSFAWRLVMAPLPIVDYVVVHELVHLRYRNHGKRFWGRVRAILPDYRAREDWLDEHGHLLRLA